MKSCFHQPKKTAAPEADYHSVATMRSFIFKTIPSVTDNIIIEKKIQRKQNGELRWRGRSLI